MSIRSVLVPLLPQDEPSPMLNAALQIARRFEGHLDALFIGPDGNEAIAVPPPHAGQPITLDEGEAAHRLAATASRVRFDEWCEASTPTGEAAHAAALKTTTRWLEQTGPIDRVLPAYGRLSDLIVLHYPTRHVAESDRVFTVATFATGRPVLLVRREVPKDILQHVLVAWDGGLPAARALAGAMPGWSRSSPRPRPTARPSSDRASAKRWRGTAFTASRPGLIETTHWQAMPCCARPASAAPA